MLFSEGFQGEHFKHATINTPKNGTTKLKSYNKDIT